MRCSTLSVVFKRSIRAPTRMGLSAVWGRQPHSGFAAGSWCPGAERYQAGEEIPHSPGAFRLALGRGPLGAPHTPSRQPQPAGLPDVCLESLGHQVPGPDPIHLQGQKEPRGHTRPLHVHTPPAYTHIPDMYIHLQHTYTSPTGTYTP